MTDNMVTVQADSPLPKLSWWMWSPAPDGGEVLTIWNCDPEASRDADDQPVSDVEPVALAHAGPELVPALKRRGVRVRVIGPNGRSMTVDAPWLWR